MASELLIRSPAADLFARALVMAWRGGIRLYDPSLAQAREPDIEAKLLRDADIAMGVKLRQHMIAGQQWLIEPATDSDVNKAAARVMRELVQRIRSFTQARHNLARAFLSGQRFATMQGEDLPLRIGDGQPRTWNVVQRLVDHDKRRFRWVPNQMAGESVQLTASLEVLSLKTSDWVKVEHPDWLIKHTYDDSEEMLGYGRGLREALYWWWYAKEHLFRESLQAAERFGQGIITAKIAGMKDADGMPNTELVTAWKKVLDEMRAQHIIVYDKDDEIEVINMTGQGWQLMSTLREELRNTVRTLILGANLTTNAEGGSGSYALAQVQENSTQSLVQYDRETLEETITTDLIGYLWRANWHNLVALGLQEAEMPRFKIKQEREQDPKEFSQVLAAALGAGLPVRQDEGYGGLGLTPPKDGDEVIEPPQQPAPGMGGGFPPGAGGQPGQPGQPPQSAGGAVDLAVPGLDMSNVDLSIPPLGFGRARLTTFEDPRAKDPVLPEIRRLRRGGQRPFDWDESKHPRKGDGKFAPKGEGEDSAPDEGEGAIAGEDKRIPDVGTDIVRKYKGETYVVRVLEDGFLLISHPSHVPAMAKQTSLSKIASEITGHPQNGMVWWGLSKRGQGPKRGKKVVDDPPKKSKGSPPDSEALRKAGLAFMGDDDGVPTYSSLGAHEGTQIRFEGPDAHRVAHALTKGPNWRGDAADARKVLKALDVSFSKSPSRDSQPVAAARSAVIAFAMIRAKGYDDPVSAKERRPPTSSWNGWFQSWKADTVNISYDHRPGLSRMHRPALRGGYGTRWVHETTRAGTWMHEMGHLVHRQKLGSGRYHQVRTAWDKGKDRGRFTWVANEGERKTLREAWKQGSISQYGSSCTHEFVAESFVYMMMGGTLPPKVERIYKAVGGVLPSELGSLPKRK